MLKRLIGRFSLVLLCLFFACQASEKEQRPSPAPTVSVVEADTIPYPSDRQLIRQGLAQKVENNQPLFVHIFIPLCDSEHQNIAPTNASLSDGMDIKGNLYWATSNGTKRFFTEHRQWEKIHQTEAIDSNVLERVVFRREYENTTVYLTADAYRGDRMEACLNDFFASAALQKQAFVKDSIGIYSHADLLIFNGHNGMMDDIHLQEWKNNTATHKDVVINACVSSDYFEEPLKNASAYPLLRSNVLVHPGAYVLTQVIDDWVTQLPADSLCINADRAYCGVQECAEEEIGTLYHTGWKGPSIWD